VPGSPHRRRLACAALTLATVLVGLVWRMAPLHLPFFFWKYGGSTLWAVAVYWMVATVLPRARTLTLTALACLFALAVEFSRLIPSPALEAFRLTLAGRLILGRIFSLWNVVAYWLAIVLAALADDRHRGPELDEPVNFLE
jgi:hypothetical protein